MSAFTPFNGPQGANGPSARDLAQLVAAYNDLRETVSKKQFGKSYSALTEDQQKAVRDYYPQKISEAEPKNYGGKK